jgi:alkylation response protein AidB-like acyl-CoA dehydrogenase
MDELLGHVELRESARKLLSHAHGKRSSPSGLWHILAEHGWLSLALPEACGGLAQPFAALAVLYEELGRILGPHAFVSASLCLSALAEIDDEAARALIARTLAGEAVPMASSGSWLKASAGRVSGVIRNVLDVDEATHLLLPIEDGRRNLVLAALPHPQIILKHRATWDCTRRLYDVHVENLELSSARGFAGAHADAVSLSMSAHHDLAVACDALGGIGAIFEETLEYLQVRQQFNRPIASFQAIKHRCADLCTAIGAARALVTAACHAFSTREGDWHTAAACGRLCASAVYRRVTEDAIQLHGGIGFTWEHRCHQFLKRARLNDALGGTPEQRKDAVAPALFRAATAH